MEKTYDELLEEEAEEVFNRIKRNCREEIERGLSEEELRQALYMMLTYKTDEE